MSEEKTETVLTPEIEPVPEVKDMPEEKSAETVDGLKAQLLKVEKALKETNREAAERRKKLEAFEEAEKIRKEAETSEMDKLKLQAETAQKQAVELQKALLKRDVAAKFDVPEILVDRLKGDTQEEMEADAEKLMKELPKPKQANISATNPGGNQSIEETDAQRYKRLFGSQN